jgi:hypothetical protein
MKKPFFILPALAVSIALAFCSKTEVKEELGSVDSALKAGDRALCNVTGTSASPTQLTICSFKNNKAACDTCAPNMPGQGPLQVINGAINFDVQRPITFSVSSATGNSITLTTAAGTYDPIHIGV